MGNLIGTAWELDGNKKKFDQKPFENLIGTMRNL
jgi:hypothetical protein